MSKFTNEEFVKAWQSSENLAEVQEKLGGVHRNTVENQRTKLKKLGVNLKLMAVGSSARGETPNVSALNALIEGVSGPKFKDGERVSVAINGDSGYLEYFGSIKKYLGEDFYEVIVDQKFHTGPNDNGIRTINISDIKSLQTELSGVS